MDRFKIGDLVIPVKNESKHHFRYKAIVIKDIAPRLQYLYFEDAYGPWTYDQFVPATNISKLEKLIYGIS